VVGNKVVVQLVGNIHKLLELAPRSFGLNYFRGLS
jgi:hypothetical protein